MMYTFIVNYRGGSYIEQVSAPDVLTATHIWAERIAHGQIVKHLDSELFSKVFGEEILEFPPMPISDRPNVWQMFFFSGKNRMDVDIVKTSEAPEPSRRDLLTNVRTTTKTSWAH